MLEFQSDSPVLVALALWTNSQGRDTVNVQAFYSSLFSARAVTGVPTEGSGTTTEQDICSVPEGHSIQPDGSAGRLA